MSIAGGLLIGHIIRDMAATPTPPSPRFDSVQQEVYLGLWRTYDRLRALEDELFAKYELTAQQYNVMRLLKAARPESVPTLALADRLVSRAPDITRMIDRLEERGLVARERLAEDRRVVRVRITEAGLETVAKLAGPLAECHARQLGHLSDADLKRLAVLLREARLPHEPEGSVWR
jgi:DNA-binding MarR family transcriptional regulator